MKAEQKVVTEWMRWVMYRNNWTAEQWGEAAGIAGTTITRSMRE